MDRVAGVSDADASVETVLRPLMGAPHYKTNKAVVEAKFLQHCSTDSAVREAADKAGARFAALKAKGRTDPRIYGRVCALAALAAAPPGPLVVVVEPREPPPDAPATPTPRRGTVPANSNAYHNKPRDAARRCQSCRQRAWRGRRQGARRSRGWLSCCRAACF